MPTHQALLRRAEALLRRLAPEGWSVELFLEREAEREVSWADGRPKDLSSGVGSGASLRVMKSGRQGFASGTDASLNGIRDLFARACASARATFPDVARRLPRPPATRSCSSSSNRPSEPRVHSPPEKDLLNRLRILERRALAGDRRLKKTLNLSFHEARGAHAIVSTEGVAVAEPWGAVSFSAEILGASGKETETAWGSMEKREWDELDSAAVVDGARERLLTSFGARPLRSGPWPVIVTPRVGADLAELFSQAALGDAVEKGRSFLSDRLGKTVGSPLVTFVDDGTLFGGVATGIWDDEGIPKRRTVVVEGGVLSSHLHDTATARRANAAGTANASRPGRTAPPSPGTTNFYLAAGSVSREALYQSTPRAFVVRDVIGMHTADPASGDFSVGAVGTLWEKGKPGRAVRGVTLAGNLMSLLGRIDAVADDLAWQGTFGSPTFRVKELSVGGS